MNNKYYLIQDGNNRNLFLHRSKGFWIKDEAWVFYDLKLCEEIAKRTESKVVEVQEILTTVADYSVLSEIIKKHDEEHGSVIEKLSNEN